MQMCLIDLIDGAIEYLKGMKIRERVDSDFARVISISSVKRVLKALPEVDPANMREDVIHFYKKRMMMLSLEDNPFRLITTAQGFDSLSYSIFKFLFENTIPEQRKEKEMEVTLGIGEDIYRWFNIYSDRPFLKKLEQICAIFVRVGYYNQARILFSVWDKNETYFFDEADFLAGKKVYLGYKMVDPVIMPSATRLFVEYGGAQHFSSRTIQACLKESGVEGGEINFDPREHDTANVVELWEIQKVEV